MKSTGSKASTALILFVVACLVTIGFITALQFVQVPWLAICLVIMHGGIVCFILSRRTFKKLDIEVRRFFATQYVLLAPYVLVMIYTFLLRAGLADFLGEGKVLLVLGYSIFYSIFSLFNFLRIKKAASTS